MPIVELTGQFMIADGPQYNAGDRPYLTEDQAAAAVWFGVGRVVQEDATGEKAIAGAPSHKQVRRAYQSK
jgi:5-deoxy-D-glucuronate isomerase